MKITNYLFALVLITSSPAWAQTKDSPRLQAITSVHDTLNIAVAYHRHCVDKTRLPNENLFMNTNVVLSLLAVEIKRIDKNMTDETVANAIEIRAKMAKEKLDVIFAANDCKSPAAQEAKKAYDFFSDITSSGSILPMIEQKTKDIEAKH